MNKMKEIHSHIFSNANIPQQAIQGGYFKNPLTNIRALIMGPTGNGKTNLINNLCNEDFESGTFEGSKTRDIVYSDVSEFQEGVFRIYDTPGTDSRSETLQHALVLRASLTALPFNLVIFIAKYDNRFGKFQQEFKKMMGIFKNSKIKIILMISHFDLFDGKKNNQQYFDFIDKGDFKVPVIVFSNKNSQPAVLSRMLYFLGVQSELVKIEIDDKTFHRYFNVARNVCRPDKISNEYSDHVYQIEEELQMFDSFIQKLLNCKQVDSQLLTEVKIYAKCYLKQLQNKRYAKYYDEFNDDYLSTNLFLLISQMIQKNLEMWDKLTFQKLEKKFYEDHYKKQEDIRDTLKACPYCGLIWMKVQDCNSVTCGNKPNFFDFFKNKDNFRYQWKIVEGSITFQKKITSQVDDKKVEKNFQGRKDKGQKLGCGYGFNWAHQPRIPNIEEILKNFYGVNNYQQIILDAEFMLKNKQNYKKVLNEKVKKTYQTLNKDSRVSQPTQSDGEILMLSHNKQNEKLRQGLKVDQSTLKTIKSHQKKLQYSFYNQLDEYDQQQLRRVFFQRQLAQQQELSLDQSL